MFNVDRPAQNWNLIFFFLSFYFLTWNLRLWSKCFYSYVINEAFMDWIASVGLSFVTKWWGLTVMNTKCFLLVVWLCYKLKRVINFNTLCIQALLQTCLHLINSASILNRYITLIWQEGWVQSNYSINEGVSAALQLPTCTTSDNYWYNLRLQHTGCY